jgi:hypothetical protein
MNSELEVALVLIVFLLNSAGLVAITLLTPSVPLHTLGGLVYLLCVAGLLVVLKMTEKKP